MGRCALLALSSFSLQFTVLWLVNPQSVFVEPICIGYAEFYVPSIIHVIFDVIELTK